jgi:TetR/AcrR family transcriptional regulator, mexJK operon transcriptional repressor
MARSAAEDPRVTRSRAVILAAALEHFVAHGYVGANVDLIAEEAGVSKRTVYNVVGGKEQLFRAVLGEAIDIAERFSRQMSDELAVGVDLAADLRAIGVRLARAVLGGRIVALRRLLIAESSRFPEIAREYYERAPGLVMTTLATRLAALAEKGRLRVADPKMAAEHFAFLVMGAPLDRALLGLGTDRPPHELDAVALAGVAAFLRAYGVEDSGLAGC